ncbi:hypothetical protein CALVIDRAFT_540947 [Calocera viscosa TUFC12733]|uniref:Magnesium transporter n=1 Tax=Calocera viscosa (strain TUFC12733) TaxID=1330018 RepID=A0A167IBU6_CALVF|nr:hypothetical protein CALVIDRAFT_540947 [Calocera viscosa TUFC12733]
MGTTPTVAGEGDKTEPVQGSSEPPPSEVVQGIAQDIRHLRIREKAAASVFGVKAEYADEEHEPQAPFEFLALEALLSYALANLSEISVGVTERVSTLLHGMSTSEVISTNQLQELVEVKDAAEVFLRKAKELKAALDDVLSEPADMRMMYLSDARDGIARDLGDDDDVELLLEAYVKHASSLASTAQQNISRLQAASSHINLLLSSTRNRLLHLEIRVAITTLAFSAGGIIAGILGMNLLNGLEEHPTAFYFVVPFIALVSFTYWRIGRRALSYARRLKLSQAGMLGGAMREARIHQAVAMRKAKLERIHEMRDKVTGGRGKIEKPL